MPSKIGENGKILGEWDAGEGELGIDALIFIALLIWGLIFWGWYALFAKQKMHWAIRIVVIAIGLVLSFIISATLIVLAFVICG